MSELQKDLLDIATGNLCAWVVEKEGLSIKDRLQGRLRPGCGHLRQSDGFQQ